jgi:DNA-binding CsgD family transcriptional regulator
MASARLLAGRIQEVSLLERFLDDLLEGPRMMVLEGEVGVGKTTLLDRVEASVRARSWNLLAARPVASELPWEFAALTDLLRELPREVVDGLPPAQRLALGVVVYRDEVPDGPVDRLTLATAVRAAVVRMAETSPVVLVVDDLPWLDPPTTRILEFVLRRLGDTPVGLVGTVRTEWGNRPTPLFTDDLDPRLVDRLTVGRLDARSIDELLADREPSIVSERRRMKEIRRWSDGNPLVAVQLLTVPAGEFGSDSVPSLGVPDALRRLIGERLRSVNPQTNDVLLVAALANTPSVARTMAAALDPVTARGAVHDAVDAGFVSVRGDIVSFTHPMVRAAVIDAATPAQRRNAHLRSAEVAGTREERARHLALGSEGPDESVASEVEEAAGIAAGRGAPEIAARLATLSVELTPAGEASSRRRRAAGEADWHFLMADPQRACELLEDVVGTCPAGPERAEYLRRLARYATHRGDPSTDWVDRLSGAFDEAGEDPGLRGAIALDLAVALSNAGDQARAARYGEIALAMALESGDGARASQIYAGMAYSMFLAGGGVSDELVDLALAGPDQPAGLSMELRPRYVVGRLFSYAGRDGRSRELLEAELTATHHEGITSGLALLLGYLADLEIWAGNWDRAGHLLDELAQTGDESRVIAVMDGVRGLLQVCRGHVDDGRSAIEAAISVASAVNMPIIVLDNAYALGVACSLGDAAEAHRQLAPFVALAGAAGVTEPTLLRFVPDEVSALVRLGELEAASELLAYFEACAERSARPWPRAAAMRCRALVAIASGDASGATAAIDRAVRHHRAAGYPFEEARTLLVAGEIHRRARAKRKAADALTRAVGLFEGLGSPAWALAAREELARVGLRDTRTSDDGSTLTTAEQEVVELVISGMSNREVARHLFMSQRTVESHLTHSYRKLGVRTRTQLAAAYRPPGPGPGPR